MSGVVRAHARAIEAMLVAVSGLALTACDFPTAMTEDSIDQLKVGCVAHGGVSNAWLRDGQAFARCADQEVVSASGVTP
jgi:hypothetical protein